MTLQQYKTLKKTNFFTLQFNCFAIHWHNENIPPESETLSLLTLWGVHSIKEITLPIVIPKAK
jgi:hypothetical protein